MVQNNLDRDPTESRRRGRPRGFDGDAILCVVRDVFWNKGYAATSLDDLTSATGLSKPSLYGAFGDKRALYEAALNLSRTQSTGRLREALSGDEALRPTLERVFSVAAELYVAGASGQRGCFLVGTAVTEAVGDPEVREALSATLKDMDAAFLARFERAVIRHELPATADLPALARLATGTLNAMAVRARAGANITALTEMGRAFAALLTRSEA